MRLGALPSGVNPIWCNGLNRVAAFCYDSRQHSLVIGAYRPMSTVADSAGLATLMPHRSSLGSSYLAFHTDRDTVRTLASMELNQLFRRALLDPLQGLVVFMSPSRTHELIAGDLDRVLDALLAALDMDAVALRATRWRGPSDPKNTGAEADCCFYLGETARKYRELGDAYVHPPDLVVEIGVTHIDGTKQSVYRRLGVPEYWQIEREEGGNLRALFLDLQAGDYPVEIKKSAVLPMLAPDTLASILQETMYLSPRDFRDRILDILTGYGVVQLGPGRA